MKKLLFNSLLAMLCLHTATAQNEQDRLRHVSKTEAAFNITGIQTNIKSYVQLWNSKLTVEVQNADDYESLKGLDTIIANFRKDIAFYKDSLDNNDAGNVRIDYVISPEYAFRKIRFKKYRPDGDIFVSRKGDISRLKIEQDTIHIIIEKLLYRSKCTLPYSISATFVLDNYSDIEKAFADKEEVKRIIGTLDSTSHSLVAGKEKRFPKYTLFYNPYYTGGKSLKTRRGNFDPRLSFIHDKDYIDFTFNIGAGVIMNTLAPMGEIGISLNSPWTSAVNNYSFARLTASSCYFFQRSPESNLSVKDNWFVNFSIGSYMEKGQPGWFGNVTDAGIGYLFREKGDIFKNTTMRLFTDIKLHKGITITPEIIATNNFKQFFPGISVKVF